MVLFILLTIVLRCSSKFSLQSKNIPRCFCNATWWTGLSLKINVEWLVFVILRENITSWACLIGSVLKLIFHWLDQLLILHKSLLSSFAEVFLLCTTEKREVSSPNNFGLEDESSDRSLIYIKKNSGPRIDHWGTPAGTLVHDDVWLLRTTLCSRFFRKHFSKRRRFYKIQYWFNLSIRPSCHTLSKAFDISRNTPLTSRQLSIEW